MERIACFLKNSKKTVFFELGRIFFQKKMEKSLDIEYMLLNFAHCVEVSERKGS
jgi:hypothetical protein